MSKSNIIYNQIISKIKYFENKFKKEIKLIAVSKFKSGEEIMDIYNQGQRDFGENYIEELVEKYNSLPKDINWHFIGNIQSNKLNKLLKINPKSIQSISKIKYLELINSYCLKNNTMQEVYLQAKMSEEETKSGLDLSEIENIIANKDSYKHIIIKGFMMIGKQGDIEAFHKFNNFKIEINNKHNSNYLISMGMSGDYETAIEKGSDIVRIGTLIFGERAKNKQL